MLSTREENIFIPSANVTKLIKLIRDACWCYIRNNFAFAYEKTEISHDLQAAIDLIADYQAATERDWYPWFISKLPYASPLYRLNDLRHLYVCAKAIEDKLDSLNQSLERLRNSVGHDGEFQVYNGQVADSENELNDVLTYVYKVLDYKIVARFKNDEDCPKEIKTFTYTDKNKRDFVLETKRISGAEHNVNLRGILLYTLHQNKIFSNELSSLELPNARSIGITILPAPVISQEYLGEYSGFDSPSKKYINHLVKKARINNSTIDHDSHEVAQQASSRTLCGVGQTNLPKLKHIAIDALMRQGLFRSKFKVSLRGDLSLERQQWQISEVVCHAAAEKYLPSLLQAIVENDLRKAAEILDKLPYLVLVTPTVDMAIDEGQSGAMSLAIKYKHIRMIKLLVIYLEKMPMNNQAKSLLLQGEYAIKDISYNRL